ncbi:hypothetical protein Fmac_018590 [Flemingia macrophylla]|uniref:Uncharacterized protein n=1 Tax=Flemingia macrophylla TaxID=520843 RepID=A0ABD1M5F3_9FABA
MSSMSLLLLLQTESYELRLQAIKEPYNASQEMERKRALSIVLSQTRQQKRRDEEVLVEAKRIAESCIPSMLNRSLADSFKVERTV